LSKQRVFCAENGKPDIAVRSLGAVRRLLAHLRRKRIEDAPPSPLPWSPLRAQIGAREPTKEKAE
jgi:hypothetical protein